MFSRLAGCGDKRLLFRQCHPIRTMLWEGSRGRSTREVSEPMRAGVSLHVWVYADDKQGCTNVSGNSTSRNGWFMSKVSWKEFARYMSTFSIVRKNSLFKPFLALETSRYVYVCCELSAEALSWKSSVTINLPRLQQNAKEKLKSFWWKKKRKTKNAIGPLISIAVNILLADTISRKLVEREIINNTAE